MFRLTVHLEDGSSATFVRPSMPPHWKSWIMRQLPYGTSFYGAMFTRELV